MTSLPSISSAQRQLAEDATSAATLVEQACAVADRLDANLGIFVRRFAQTVTGPPRGAPGQSPEHGGPLHGVSIAVKDVISTREAFTSGQSRSTIDAGDYRDAASVGSLRRAGASIVGKTTTMELALGLLDDDSGFPVPRNPWDANRWPGGSSSGSAVAVSVGASLGALGTDTGGSLRIPAALCGVTGFAPSSGWVPVDGCIPLSPTLDRVGPIARTAVDCAILMDTIALEHRPARTTFAGYVRNSGRDRSLRIGVPNLTAFDPRPPDAETADLLERALRCLEDLGATLVRVEPPTVDAVTRAAEIIARFESAMLHAHVVAERPDSISFQTRLLLEAGQHVSRAEYASARMARDVARTSLDDLWREVDMVVMPTTGVAAPLLEGLNTAEPAEFAARVGPVYTAYWSALGLPAASCPMGFTSSGLPLGLQVIGPHGNDAHVLKVVHDYQSATDWHRRVPLEG